MGLRRKIEKFYEKKLEKRKYEKLAKIYGNEEKIIYLSTPEHGNLGDQAIAIGIKKILEDKFKDKNILEISHNRYNKNKEIIEKLVSKKDIITLIGGGNFGNLYIGEEKQRRDIVQRFPENKIIIMPQSITFTSDDEGRTELSKSKEIYSKHKDLIIFARDKRSCEFAQKNFTNNKVFLCPDSVLYLENSYLNLAEKRDGIIFTLRADKEKILSNEKIEAIKKYLNEKNIEYILEDTTVKYGVTRETREYEVKRILRKISSAKLNITDRFHGVIFSVITNTPVIVFKSLDHKIEEGVKWFEHLEWVHYVTEKDDINEIIDKYLENGYIVKKERFELKEEIEKIFINKEF